MELKKFAEKFKLQGNAKTRLILFAGLAGILLIFLSDLAGAPSTAAEKLPGDTGAYAEQLESRLAGLLATVEGAGRVKVMLTLESGAQLQYLQTEKSSKTDTASDSGANASRQSSYENSVVVVDGAAGRQALVETEYVPQINGVAVVCEGGDDIAVVNRITEIVSVVLGIPSNRVCVTKMS